MPNGWQFCSHSRWFFSGISWQRFPWMHHSSWLQAFFDKRLCCRLVSGYWDLGWWGWEGQWRPLISSKAILCLRAKDSHVPWLISWVPRPGNRLPFPVLARVTPALKFWPITCESSISRVCAFLPREWLSVYKQTCARKFVQFCCKGGRIGFMRRRSPLWGCVWGVPLVYTRFALWFVCLALPLPVFFLLSWSSPIAFSPADSHVRNSSLESPGLC